MNSEKTATSETAAPEAPAPAAPLVPATQWTDPVVLTGRFIRLEPLSTQHAAGIFQHADEETVALVSRGGPAEQSVQGWAEYIGRLNAVPGRVNWAVVVLGGRDGGADQIAGRVSYSAVQPADRWAEIGTMLTPPFRGGFCNPEAKLLLMERAFTVLGAGRIHFKVDARNARSRAAMHKLGATEEGTLRRYQVRPDGVARDSVMFSVLREEWPTVRAELLARLERFIR